MPTVPTDLERSTGAARTVPNESSRGGDHLVDPLWTGALQLDVGTPSGAGDPHERASRGLTGPSTPLPFGERIQASFGSYDISGVEAYTGGAADRAASSLGASAYALGSSVAFKGSPDLHTAAHEAAHTVQQQNGGLQLLGGVGRVGDVYEKNADDVADLVVRGESAEAALDSFAGGGGRPGLQLDTSSSDPPPDTVEWDWDDSELKWSMFWEGEWWLAWQDGEVWMSQSESGREETWDGSSWVAVESPLVSSGGPSTVTQDEAPTKVEAPTKKEGTGKKVGKAVLKGLGGAALGPFKYLFKSYRDDLNGEVDRDYKNSFLNGINKVSAFTGYMGAMMGWCVLVMGLVAAILAATGIGLPIAAALAGTVPIFGWLAATFAGATAVLKGTLAAAGAIRTWNMQDKVEKARLRAMMWGDVLSSITQAGAAAVGGTFAMAGGGAYTGGNLGSQVTTAVSDPIKSAGTHLVEQSINQGFNSGSDVLNSFAPDSDESAAEAAKLLKEISPQADKAWTDIAVPAKADSLIAKELATRTKPHSDELVKAASKNPKGLMEGAARGELASEQAVEEREGEGNSNSKAQVVKRSQELESADSRKSLEQKDANLSEGRQAIQESKSAKKPGWFARQWNKLFSGAAGKAQAKLLSAATQAGGIPKDQVDILADGVGQLGQAGTGANELEAAVSLETALRDKVVAQVKE